MARPRKATVDYFPLVCQFGDSITALENIYGNDGFVVWIKLLQKLGRTENHIIDIRTQKQWKLFYSIFKIDESLVKEIIEELVELECLDEEFYKKGFLFSENFVENVADAYKKRNSKVLTKEELFGIYVGENSAKNESYGISGGENPQKSDGNPQIKLNEIKLNESKDIDTHTINVSGIDLCVCDFQILMEYAKKSGAKNKQAYIYALVSNGGYRQILERERKRVESRRVKEKKIREDLKSMYNAEITPEEDIKIREIQTRFREEHKIKCVWHTGNSDYKDSYI